MFVHFSTKRCFYSADLMFPTKEDAAQSLVTLLGSESVYGCKLLGFAGVL